MSKKNSLFPEEILKIIPLRYHYLDEISPNDEQRNIKTRVIENNFYKASKKMCVNNYRKTSKLLRNNEFE